MWVDDTRYIPLHRYTAAKNRFFDHFSSMEGVVNYGTFGSVRALGLSDLDLIVEVDDDFLKAGKFSFPELQGDERYIFLHRPLVVPSTLLPLLPYIHLIDVNWEGNKHVDTQRSEVDIDRETLSLLNILSKTIYLQSFLWRLLFLPKKPARRGIVAITSVSRSIEWSKRLGFPFTAGEEDFILKVSNFRENWVEKKELRNEYIKDLDDLLFESLNISIGLPERLVTDFIHLELSTPMLTNTGRGLHRSPLNYLYDSGSNTVDQIIDSVLRRESSFRFFRKFGKIQSLLVGTFAFTGPLSYAVFKLEQNLRAQEYNSWLGSYHWGDAVDEEIQQVVSRRFLDCLTEKYIVNLKLAKMMAEAKLVSNFGNVWYDLRFSGLVTRIAGKCVGRIRPIRF